VQCAEILLAPSPARDRLTSGICLGYDDDAIAGLERAFDLVTETEPIRKKVRAAGLGDWQTGRKKKAIDADEAKRMEQADAAVGKAIDVDDFAAEEIGPRKSAAARPE
jgi:acyl-CoA dehydrogenase